MKKRLVLLGTLCIPVLCSACTVKRTNTTNDGANSVTTEAITTEVGTTACHDDIEGINKLDVPDSIKDVFTKDESFTNTYSNSETKKSELKKIRDTQFDELFWNEYTVVDLDQDGINELIFRVAPSKTGEPTHFIFHESNNTVYAYQVSYRAMLDISTDGELYGSSSATDGDYYTISFEENKLNIHNKVRSKGNLMENTTTYYKGDKVINEDEFYA